MYLAPLNPFFLSVTTYSSTFFLRWDFKSESETGGATKTKQKALYTNTFDGGIGGLSITVLPW